MGALGKAIAQLGVDMGGEADAGDEEAQLGTDGEDVVVGGSILEENLGGQHRVKCVSENDESHLQQGEWAGNEDDEHHSKGVEGSNMRGRDLGNGMDDLDDVAHVADTASYEKKVDKDEAVEDVNEKKMAAQRLPGSVLLVHGELGPGLGAGLDAVDALSGHD